MAISPARAILAVLALLLVSRCSAQGGPCGGLDSCPTGQCTDGVCDLGLIRAVGDSQLPAVSGAINPGVNLEPGLEQCAEVNNNGVFPYCGGLPYAAVIFTVEAGITIDFEASTCGAIGGASEVDTAVSINQLFEDGSRTCVGTDEYEAVVCGAGPNPFDVLRSRMVAALGAGRYQVNICASTSGNKGSGPFTLAFQAQRYDTSSSCGGVLSCPGTCSPSGVCDLGAFSPGGPDTSILSGAVAYNLYEEPGLDQCGERCSRKPAASVAFSVDEGTLLELDSGPCQDIGGASDNFESMVTLNRIEEDDSHTCIDADFSSCESGPSDASRLRPAALGPGRYILNICGYDLQTGMFELALRTTVLAADVACGGALSCPGTCLDDGVCDLGELLEDSIVDVDIVPIADGKNVEPGLDACTPAGGSASCASVPGVSLAFQTIQSTTIDFGVGRCEGWSDIPETVISLNRLDEDGGRTCVDAYSGGCQDDRAVSKITTDTLPPGSYVANICQYGVGAGPFTLDFNYVLVERPCAGFGDCAGTCVDNVCDLGLCRPGDPDVRIVARRLTPSPEVVEPGLDQCNLGESWYTCANQPLTGSLRFSVAPDTSVDIATGNCRDALGGRSDFDSFMSLNRINSDGTHSCIDLDEGECDTSGAWTYYNESLLTTADLEAGTYQINLCPVIRDSSLDPQSDGFTLVFTKTLTVDSGGDQGDPPVNDSGGVEGDPHMTGFDGSSFNYDGEPGAAFCLVATRGFQVNALLMPDLSEGMTYVGAVGVSSSTGHTASVRAAMVDDRLVAVLDDVVVELSSEAGQVVQGGDIRLAAAGDGDVLVSVPGLSMVLEVHRSIFLNIKDIRLTGPHPEIDGVLGETARANRPVVAGTEHEESHYFVESLLTHAWTKKSPRRMGEAGHAGSEARLTAAGLTNRNVQPHE